ncbi:hypothetical protein PS15p_200760 [Mucor circinelloides]
MISPAKDWKLVDVFIYYFDQNVPMNIVYNFTEKSLQKCAKVRSGKKTAVSIYYKNLSEVDGEHTEEDTLNLMEATSRCLKNEMGRYQSSSWNTFGARKVLAIQAINNTITLLSTKRVEGNKWTFVEQRSVLISRDWEDSIYWVKVVELLMKLNVSFFFIIIIMRVIMYDIQ